MHSEDHVVDDSLVDQVADFDEARNRGDHSENRHLELVVFYPGTEDKTCRNYLE